MQSSPGDLSNTDLSEMFRRSLNISSTVSSSQSLAQPTLVRRQQDHVQEESTSINYSVSQHYTHSAHIAQAINTEQTSVGKFVGSRPSGLSMYQILTQNNIAPSSLVQSQLTLFEQADDDQRARLIQLWSLSSPQRTIANGPPLVSRTNEYRREAPDQAQELIWLQQQREAFRRSFQSGGDPRCDGDYGSWSEGSNLEDAETYITSGYEQLAERDYQEQSQGTIPTLLSASAGLIFDSRYSHAADPIYRSLGWHNVHPIQRAVGHHVHNNFDLANH